MGDIIKWQDKPVDVQARLVPRFLWNTASVDVFLAGECILRTGGQFKFTGTHHTTFMHSGSTHTAELSWGNAGLRTSFPYQLRIDGVLVSDSRVRINNKMMGFVGAIFFAGLCVLILHVLLHV